MQELTPQTLTRLKTNIALNLTATVTIAILGVVTFLLFILVLVDEYLSHRRGVRLRGVNINLSGIFHGITLGTSHSSNIAGDNDDGDGHLRVNSHGGGRGEEDEGDDDVVCRHRYG